jgi:3-hydroxyacyl-CoA dehydrogenase
MNSYRVDDAIKAGFGWEIGAFETWDLLGVKDTVEAIEKGGSIVAPWVKEKINNGNTHFYKSQNGKRLCYDPLRKL